MKIETLWDNDDGTPWAAFVRGHDQNPTRQQLWDALNEFENLDDDYDFNEGPALTRFYLRADTLNPEVFYHSKEGYDGAFPVTGIRF